jgi:non-heme chloroperoxidase
VGHASKVIALPHVESAGRAASLSAHEEAQIGRANASGAQPVVFVHGLWLLATSWDRWAEDFEAEGYVALAPGWPDDPETVADAAADPEVFANKTVGQVADHYAQVVSQLERKPMIVGHSFGGLLAQLLAGHGLSAATVAIDPAPFQGVLPLPISALRSAWPVLSNPSNRHRAVPLTFDQFRFAFANAVDETEARELYATFAVPGSGEPLFEAAGANFNPWSEVKVDTHNAERGPLLIVSGARDHTVPGVVAKAAYTLQSRNPGVTEFRELPGRGHALTIDHGWREVADLALAFLRRFA